jgi:glyoxylate reductase
MNCTICITRHIPEAAINLLQDALGPVKVNPHDRSLTPGELCEFVARADAVLSMLADRVDAAVMDAAGPQLRVVANYAVGYNNIDLQAATHRHIVVTNTPGVLDDATADLTWSLLLAAARRIVEADAHVRTGTWTGWDPLQFLGVDVAGQTIGIVGGGRIGTAVARRATGFGMRILYTGRQSHHEIEAIGGVRVDLRALLAESDFVSLHVPLTAQTRHMIGEAELACMKSTAVLVNTSRGPVVHEQALVEALRNGRIAAAGLDVYENEPIPAPGLVALPNVVILPHIGSATHKTRQRMAIMAAQSIVDVLQGRQPRHVVNL